MDEEPRDPLIEVASEQLALIVRRMTALEGADWAAGAEPEIHQLVEGPQTGKIVYRVGDRQFAVEGDEVIVTTISRGRPVRRLVIDDAGIRHDDEIIRPDEN
jgi:hypothetical protein